MNLLQHVAIIYFLGIGRLEIRTNFEYKEKQGIN